jgi:hypothetical protein
MEQKPITPKTDDQIMTEQYSNWNTVRNAFLLAGIFALIVYFQNRKK